MLLENYLPNIYVLRIKACNPFRAINILEENCTLTHIQDETHLRGQMRVRF